MGLLFPDVPEEFEVIQGPVQVSARGITENGLLVRVFAEGEVAEEEVLKGRVVEFFRETRLKLPPAEVEAPMPEEAAAPAEEAGAKDGIQQVPQQ